MQLLDCICKDEKDGLLARALSFCEQRFRELDQPIIDQAITDTFKSTLTDDPSSRAPIEVSLKSWPMALGKSSIHDVGSDNIAWCSKVRPNPVYPRLRRQPISENFGEGLDLEGALKLPVIRTAESGKRNARRQHGSSRASSIQDGQPNFTVNVFQEAEKIVKAR